MASGMLSSSGKVYVAGDALNVTTCGDVGWGDGELFPPLHPASTSPQTYVRDMKLLAANFKAAVPPAEVQLTITEGAHHNCG